MKTFINIQNVKLSKDGHSLGLKDENGEWRWCSVNLIKHELGIAYTKKDGTHVTVEAIKRAKINSAERLAQAIRKQAIGQ